MQLAFSQQSHISWNSSLRVHAQPGRTANPKPLTTRHVETIDRRTRKPPSGTLVSGQHAAMVQQTQPDQISVATTLCLHCISCPAAFKLLPLAKFDTPRPPPQTPEPQRPRLKHLLEKIGHRILSLKPAKCHFGARSSETHKYRQPL